MVAVLKYAPSPRPSWRGFSLGGIALGEPMGDGTLWPSNSFGGQANRARELALGHQVIYRGAGKPGDILNSKAAKVLLRHQSVHRFGHVVSSRDGLGHGGMKLWNLQ